MLDFLEFRHISWPQDVLSLSTDALLGLSDGAIYSFSGFPCGSNLLVKVRPHRAHNIWCTARIRIKLFTRHNVSVKTISISSVLGNCYRTSSVNMDLIADLLDLWNTGYCHCAQNPPTL